MGLKSPHKTKQDRQFETSIRTNGPQGASGDESGRFFSVSAIQASLDGAL